MTLSFGLFLLDFLAALSERYLEPGDLFTYYIFNYKSWIKQFSEQPVQPFFLLMVLFVQLALLFQRFYTSTVLLNILFALPIMFFAMYIGNHLHTNITQRAFQKAIGIFLIFSGFALLFK